MNIKYLMLISIFVIAGLSSCDNAPNAPNATDPEPDADDMIDSDPPAITLTADAGTDLEIKVGYEVMVDGSGTSTSEGTITYSWEITRRPDSSTADLADATNPVTTLRPDLPGEYELTLTAAVDTVTDVDATIVTAIAKRVFIDAQTGSDNASNGYIPERPFKTINKALQIVGLNETDPFHMVDTLRISEGRYDEANGEVFPIEFPGQLMVLGDESSNRNNILISSPNVDREPAVILNPGNVLRHIHVENGYTGTDPSGAPHVLFVNNGEFGQSSEVNISDITATASNPVGFMLTAGSNITVNVEGAETLRSMFFGNGIARAYSTRFNTNNTTVNFSETDFIDLSANSNGAFRIGNSSANHRVSVNSVLVKPGATAASPGPAFHLRSDQSHLTLNDVQVTSSDGSATGNRFRSAVSFGNNQPQSTVLIENSILEYTSDSAVLVSLSDFEIRGSTIRGVNTQNPGDITFLSRAGIELHDGSLTVRNTVMEDIIGNGIRLSGPSASTIEVNLGDANNDGNNTFSNISGFDISDVRNNNSDFVGQIEAIGNMWSNGGNPRCTDTLQDPELAEIFVSDEGNSIRWGEQANEVCAK